MHQGFTPALLLVAHVYSRNSSTTVWNLPRSDNWVSQPLQDGKHFVDCPGQPCLLAGQVSGRTELSLSLSGCQSYSSTGPRQLKAGAGIFGGTVDVHKVCCCRCSGRF